MTASGEPPTVARLIFVVLPRHPVVIPRISHGGRVTRRILLAKRCVIELADELPGSALAVNQYGQEDCHSATCDDHAERQRQAAGLVKPGESEPGTPSSSREPHDTVRAT